MEAKPARLKGMVRRNGRSLQNIAVIGIAALFVWGMAAGCQTTGSSRQGLIVPKGNRIMIQRDGESTGTFATRNMTVNYTFHVKGDKLMVSGTWETRYRDIDRLSMTLFDLDADGVVIDDHPFFARPQRAVKGRVMDNRFHLEFELPVEARAFSIGYTGRSGLGGTEGYGRVFRHSPF